MNSSSYDPADTIADGLAVFAVATNDHSVTQEGAALYRRLSRKIRETMRPGDTCRLALPGVIVTPTLRTACFTAVLDDRVLIVYERGVFRKTAKATIIPTYTVSDVRSHTSSTWSSGSAYLITISGHPSVTIALPLQAAVAAAHAIRDALEPISR